MVGSVFFGFFVFIGGDGACSFVILWVRRLGVLFYYFFFFFVFRGICISILVLIIFI